MITYRDPNTGRFISQSEAKRRRIRGRRVKTPVVARDRSGRFVPLDRPTPLPRPRPVPRPVEPVPIPADWEEELEELEELFPELDELDDADEIIADAEGWYHGEGAHDAWIKEKQKKAAARHPKQPRRR